MINDEEFEKHFATVNASWTYEDLVIDDYGKDIIRRRLMGEIDEIEFKKLVIERTHHTQLKRDS